MTARTHLAAGLLAMVALGAAGCGGSSSPSNHQASTSTTTKRAQAPAGGGTSSTPAATATAKTGTTATATTGIPTAPPPTPAGTPPAPDGLSQTTGYSTYELCATQCSGAVPSSLRRPLQLPSLSAGGSCPVRAGGGPVSVVGSPTQLAVSSFVGSSWQGGRVTWQSSASYQGPALIRGLELGGPHAVGFGEGHVPYDELQLLGRAMGAPAGPGRQWPSFTRVRSAGCYAYQVDTTGSSDVIVFRATG